MNNNTELEFLKSNMDTFLSYLKEKYPLFNNSNIFLRDIQYGIKHFFELRNKKLTYRDVEVISKDLIMFFESNGVFIPVYKNTWKLNYSKPENVTI